MSLPYRRALAGLLGAALLVACNSGTTEPVPVLDCATLATTLSASASSLTTLPDSLRYRDQVVGTGATVAAGQTLTVQYAGCLTDGTKFGASDATQPTLTFKVGAGQLIKGFDEGVVGMKVGGRRQLVIPPSLGYGSTAVGPIPANSTLVFTIDALAVQ